MACHYYGGSKSFSKFDVFFPHVRFFLPDKEGWYINPRVEDSALRAEGLKVGSALLCFLYGFMCLYASFFPNILIIIA